MNTFSFKVGAIVLAVIAIIAAVAITFSVAAAGVVVVGGSTSDGENQPGWIFGRDLTTYTAYEFNSEFHTSGSGGLYAGPITNTNSGNFNFDIPDNPPNNDKFIAEYFPEGLLTSDFVQFSYDVKMGPNSDSSQSDMFYLNIYANIDDSDNFYDCRYDYVAEGVSAESIKKHVVLSGSGTTDVKKRGDRIGDCPSVISAMPEGSYIRAFAINMGDTSGDDTGLDAYFDNAQLQVLDDNTVFDFEAGPQSKADCQKKGWKTHGFKNQGQCLKYTERDIDTR